MDRRQPVPHSPLPTPALPAPRVTLRIASLLIVSLLTLQACSGLPEPPTRESLVRRSERNPVILVAGLTGVELRHRDTGKVLWGNGWSLYFPRDGGTTLALPLEARPGDDRPEPLSHLAPSPLEPSEVIRSVSLLGIRKAIYDPIYELLEANGWTLGDLRNPRPGEDFFPFVYDWRQDKVANAALLARQLEALRRMRRERTGEPTLSVTLICQSCGAHLCRWLAKYGGASLEEAEAGAVPGGGVRVDKVILVGSSNGGSLRILRELHRGRTYLPLGRRWLPETLFTFRSLYQDLPAYRADFFVDQGGRPLELDLYDAQAWRGHGWSVFSPQARRRLEKRRRKGPRGEAGAGIFGTEAERLAFLQRQLDRARRFQRLLKADAPGFRDTRYYLVQGSRTPTPDRAVIVAGAKGKAGRRLLFTGDSELERLGLSSAVSAPGDEHATVASQMWLSVQETEALARDPFYAPGGHFELVLAPEAQVALTEMLGD